MGLNKIIKIGDNIKKERIAKGLTQKEMAKRIGVAYSTYSNYENNNREPSEDIIVKIAEELQINTDKLIFGFTEEDIFIYWLQKKGYLFSFEDRKEDGCFVTALVEHKFFTFTYDDIKKISGFAEDYFDLQILQKEKRGDYFPGGKKQSKLQNPEYRKDSNE